MVLCLEGFIVINLVFLYVILWFVNVKWYCVVYWGIDVFGKKFLFVEVMFCFVYGWIKSVVDICYMEMGCYVNVVVVWIIVEWMGWFIKFFMVEVEFEVFCYDLNECFLLIYG